jgi:hypothetical protein
VRGNLEEVSSKLCGIDLNSAAARAAAAITRIEEGSAGGVQFTSNIADYLTNERTRASTDDDAIDITIRFAGKTDGLGGTCAEFTGNLEEVSNKLRGMNLHYGKLKRKHSPDALATEPSPEGTLDTKAKKTRYRNKLTAIMDKNRAAPSTSNAFGDFVSELQLKYRASTGKPDHDALLKDITSWLAVQQLLKSHGTGITSKGKLLVDLDIKRNTWEDFIWQRNDEQTNADAEVRSKIVRALAQPQKCDWEYWMEE